MDLIRCVSSIADDSGKFGTFSVSGDERLRGTGDVASNSIYPSRQGSLQQCAITPWSWSIANARPAVDAGRAFFLFGNLAKFWPRRLQQELELGPQDVF